MLLHAVLYCKQITISKILTRNAYAKPIVKDGDSTKVAHSKADVLNLMSNDVSSISSFVVSLINMVSTITKAAVGCGYIYILMGMSFLFPATDRTTDTLGPSAIFGLLTILITSPLAYFFTKLEYKMLQKGVIIADKQNSLLQEMVQAISMIKLMSSERFWYNRLRSIKEEEMHNSLKVQLISGLSSLI